MRLCYGDDHTAASSGGGSSGFDLAGLNMLRIGLVAAGSTRVWQAFCDCLQSRTEMAHLLCGSLPPGKKWYIEGSLVR